VLLATAAERAAPVGVPGLAVFGGGRRWGIVGAHNQSR
jgi:hypothetical protein